MSSLTVASKILPSVMMTACLPVLQLLLQLLLPWPLAQGLREMLLKLATAVVQRVDPTAEECSA